MVRYYYVAPKYPCYDYLIKIFNSLLLVGVSDPFEVNVLLLLELCDLLLSSELLLLIV